MCDPYKKSYWERTPVHQKLHSLLLVNSPSLNRLIGPQKTQMFSGGKIDNSFFTNNTSFAAEKSPLSGAVSNLKLYFAEDQKVNDKFKDLKSEGNGHYHFAQGWKVQFFNTLNVFFFLTFFLSV